MSPKVALALLELALQPNVWVLDEAHLILYLRRKIPHDLPFDPLFVIPTLSFYTHLLYHTVLHLSHNNIQFHFPSSIVFRALNFFVARVGNVLQS